MKTLLVDGDPRTQRSLVEALRRRNHAVSVATDADSACEAFGREASSLVILEAETAAAGIELCSRLRALPRGPQAVMLALTRSADPAHLSSLVAAGFDDYLPRATGDGELLDLRLAVAERRLSGANDADSRDQRRRELESHFGNLFENLPDFVVVVDPAGKIQLHNRSLHVTPNQLVGATGFGFMAPEHQEACRQSLCKACQTREVQLVTVRDIFGAWYDCRVVPIVEDGVVQQAMIICTDVTGRHEAERALRESQQRFELAILAAEAGIWDCDLRTNRTFYSAHWKNMLGHGEDEISDAIDEWRDRVHPDDLPEIMARRADYLEGRSAQYNCEYRLRHKDGSYRWVKAHGLVLRDFDGQPYRFVGLHVDITQRKQSEEEIRKDRRLLRRLLDLHEQERKVLAFEIHDGFAQQLTGAFLHLQTHGRLKQQDPEQAQAALDTAAKVIVRSIDETRRLIGGLRPPALDESGLVSAIDYVICETLEPAGIEVEFTHRLDGQRLAPPLESAVFRIVQESLTNVRRHSRAKKAQVELVQDGQSIHIKVRDWGVGFDPDGVEPSHFGLQGIAERARLLGGKSMITSDPGAGTCVCVLLPLVETGVPIQGNPHCD